MWVALTVLAVLVVLAAFGGYCWLTVNEGDGFWLTIPFAALLALKALYEVTAPLDRLSQPESRR